MAEPKATHSSCGSCSHEHDHNHSHGDGEFNLKQELIPLILVTNLSSG